MNMFKSEIIFDKTQFDVGGAYTLSFSTCPTNKEEIDEIFTAYEMKIINDVSVRLMRFPREEFYYAAEKANEDWFNVEGILIEVHPRQLDFIVPILTGMWSHGEDNVNRYKRLPIFSIELESCLDNELRAAPVRIRRMEVKEEK